jgi:hypothetical protein
VTVSPNPQNDYFITQQANYAQWSLACTRDTLGTYVVSWSTDLTPAADANTENIMYCPVTGDGNPSWNFTTEYGVYSGTDTPVAYCLWPWVATPDLSSKNKSLIAWVYVSNPQQGSPYPGIIDTSWFLMP